MAQLPDTGRESQFTRLENNDGSFGWTNDEFEAWILAELTSEAPELYQNFTEVFHRSATCIRKWRERFRGDDSLWKRIFKRDRVVKEVIESVPIIHFVEEWIERNSRDSDPTQNLTIIDLCSGKGYLSMLLSEYLPQGTRVEKVVLVDKAWPMCHAELKSHHINWEHIYGNTSEGMSYFETWPIPLHTSKQNLKAQSTLRSMKKRLSTDSVLILGVHLCGTLSIQAIKLFHELPKSKMMVLKPCCLPGMSHVREKTHFAVGAYQFPTKDVCAPGRFQGDNWDGPPRWQLEGKFRRWCGYLNEAMQENEEVKSSRMVIFPIQQKGFQNTFLFAEKNF